jgi:hypothetical protein
MKEDTSLGTNIAAGFIAVLIAALLVEFAWNVGLVGLLAAAGIAQIGGISYWTATGVLALSLCVRGLFVPLGGRRGTVVQIVKGAGTND